MKKLLRRLLVAALLAVCGIAQAGNFATALGKCVPFNPDCGCECAATNKTFFTVRPPYQLNSPEFIANFHSDRLEAAGKPCRNGTVQVTLFGGQSTKKSNLGRYFGFDCSERLYINESTTASNTDILAEQLNIYTVGGVTPATLVPPFSSTIDLEPSYSFGGIGITWMQEFAQREDGRSWWVLVSTPLTIVSTTMNLSECITQNGGGVSPETPNAVANATEAFAQSSWRFGRIQQCTKTKTGLGDVTLLLGYEIVRHEAVGADGYLGILIPAGNKVRGRRIFEPVVGHNHHTGLILGGSADILMWECDNSSLTLVLDGHSQYMLENCEVRSFDLKNKPWSRYMQVYANQAQAQEAYDLSLIVPTNFGSLTLGEPGINIFTQPLRVHPGLIYVDNTAFVYTCNCWQAEVGYNFYARQQECVELARPWQTGAALKSLLGGGATDGVQIIGNVFNNNNEVPFISFPAGPAPIPGVINYDTNLIKSGDLDLNSAAHPGIISNTFYGSIAHNRTACDHPHWFALGGSYEWATTNTVMNRWTVWLKGGVSF